MRTDCLQVYRRDDRQLSRYAVGMQTNTLKTATNAARCLMTLVICAACGFLLGCNDTVSDDSIEFASLTQTRALLQDKPGVARAVDVRPPADFAAAHIPGALNLDLALVSENKDSIDPALARYKTLVVYGQDPGSGAARAMAKRLMRAGHKGVLMFSGGMAEWTGAGLKVEGSPPKAASPSAPTPK
jgi:rhodanese-related sulfurtransferase